MKTVSRYWFTRTLLLLAFLSTGKHVVVAQPGNGLPEILRFHFLNDSVGVEENNYAFNNLSIQNSGNRSLHVQLILRSPEIASLITSDIIETELRQHENQLIPIRFTLASKSAALIWVPFQVEMRIRELNQVIHTRFYIRPKAQVKWKALLKQPVLAFMETDKQLAFNIYLENTGNSPDTYSFDFRTDLSLNLAKKNYTVSLQPGEARTITAQVLLSPRDLQQLKKEEITIFIKNSQGETKMLNQQINRLGFMYSGENDSYKKMPLTLELNMQNLASDQPFAFLNLRGNLKLKNDQQLNLLLQTNNYSPHSVANTQRATVEYVHGPWRITGGSIIDFNNFLVDGTGLRLQYTGMHNKSIEVMGVQSRTGNTQQYNVKGSHPVMKGVSWFANAFVQRDAEKEQTSSLLLNKLQWTIDKDTRLSIEGGSGFEKLSRSKLDTSLAAWQAGYHFERQKKHYQISSTISRYSENFPGFNKGAHYQLHEARVLIDHFFTGPYFEINKRAYNNTGDSLINYLFNVNNREYGLRFGWQHKQFTLVLSPGILKQVQDSITGLASTTYKIAANLNWQLGDRWWFSAFSNAGRVNIPASSLPGFNSFTNFMNLQNGRYGIQLRYDKGPYYYYEIKEYLQSPVAYKRLQVSPFLELPWTKKNLFCRLQANYLNEEQSGVSFFLLYNNIQYTAPKTGIDVAVTTQLNLSRKEAPLLNLTIRKRLQLPVIKNETARSFRIVLYLDKNNNHWPDENEVWVKNARVLVNNELLQTNSKGEIYFTNADDKEFIIDFSQIAGFDGWMPRQGFRQVFRPAKDQKLYFFPFTPSHVITGKLALLRDEQSSLTMLLDGIRIIATAADGTVYNTLTNSNGEYAFNLPAGQYIISINQAVFDDNFRVAGASKTADLVNNQRLHLQFEIRQKKRVMNVRRE
ncbi:carboxypeptidase-like regulatory domain-containing protein [Longitalea arenae]|uniref:carboxypeptidase-like regulatory domain-containing protein n=1 Tax=Longitalea arenae TaxID=2812558 RepID=UPI001967AAD2|nr:carboxypeptidase-like regulatory domain-containing protein [Longitalea arenae]